jgi:Ca-activated chloride channel family protein
MNAQAAILTTTSEALVTLTGVSAEARVTPGTTEVTVKQFYKNPESIPVEAVYTFPLPMDAVLLDMHVQLGDRVLIGKILPKKEAEESYEDAITDGDKAIMLEKLPSGLYTMNVGNLMPGDDCVISYRFTSLNRWNGDTLRFSLPTTIAPRFGDPMASGLTSHQEPEYSLAEDRGLSITVHVMDELANANISCPSHPCTIAGSDTATRVTLMNETIAMDRDFVLNIETKAGSNSSARIVPDQGGWLVHTSFCPHIDATAEQLPKAVKLVLDCSGSMSGGSIQQGREALLRIIDSLAPGDYFSLLRFGSHFEHVFGGEGMLRVTDANVAMAKARVQMLDADMGGTQIASAIEAALRTFGPADIPADLFLITDGNIWDHESSVQAARNANHRIFTVGVGSAVTESYVRGLAEETGGACELVSPHEDMAGRIHRHFLRMSAPRCEDMRVHFDSAPSRAFPKKKGAIYDGDTVHLFHWFSTMPSNDVVIDLKLADGQVMSSKIPLRQAEVQDVTADMAHDIARMAAATVIRSGVDARAGQKLALDYQLMSEWTNCLVVDKSDNDQSELPLPELRKVRSPIAAGWGGTGISESASMEMRSESFDSIRSSRLEREEHSDSISSFFMKYNLDAHSGLTATIKQLISSMHAGSIVPPSIAALPLDAATEKALLELVKDGLDESLVVSAFLHYFALAGGSGRFNREDSRVLRKRFRTELAKSGEDEEVIKQKIEKIAAAVTKNEVATF